MSRFSSGSVFPVAVVLLGEQEEHASRFLGLPLWIWQIANLVGFFAVLVYFVAKPMTAAFRKRQLEIEEHARQAEKQRAEVNRLAADIRERTAKLEREIAEVRKQGIAEGESAQAELSARARDEAQRIGRDAQAEIERHLAAAKAQLRGTATELMARKAEEILSSQINDEDRRRLLADSISGLRDAR